MRSADATFSAMLSSSEEMPDCLKRGKKEEGIIIKYL
jgi:hypothetical protein